MALALDWATETFGTADLGDRRLNRRLVDIAATAAAHPSGKVTTTMQTSAQKEGAFRFLENQRVDSQALTDSMGRGTAVKAAAQAQIYVPVDQTDLTFVDRKGVRGLGPDNAKMSKSLRTTQVMNALALDDRGIPIGLLDQQWWLRSEEDSPHWKEDKRPPEERESYYWVRSVEACDERLAQLGKGCRAWYLIDRGADVAAFLKPSVEQGRLFTVRAAQNRVIKDGRGRKRKLFSTLSRQPVAGSFSVSIPPGPERLARTAECQVRFLPKARVKLGRHDYFELSAVFVREVGHVPEGQERIEWRLLTSATVSDFNSAMQVVDGYTLRWRVEEFHRTWKSGGCNVEQSQLRSFEAIRRWATILAAVAARVERLKRLSRETPDVDALTEVSQAEIDLAIAYTEDKRFKPGDKMNLREAVRLIAMVGGYMGRNSDGPPGSTTIRRGLERLAPAVKAMENLRGSG